MIRTENRSIGNLLLCLGGPVVWATHFFLLYLAQALICTSEAGPGRDRHFALTAAAVTFIAVIGLLGFLVLQLRHAALTDREPESRDASCFLHEIGAVLAALALLGSAWIAWPAFTLGACTVVAG